jgi:hypothetical protein
MQNDIDVNVLVGIYNQKINTIFNQNILLEAQIQSLTKSFSEEKNILLKANLELQQKYDALVRGNKKQSKTETSTFEDGGTD